jgi:hypothetical protein
MINAVIKDGVRKRLTYKNKARYQKDNLVHQVQAKVVQEEKLKERKEEKQKNYNRVNLKVVTLVIKILEKVEIWVSLTSVKVAILARRCELIDLHTFKIIQFLYLY